MIEKFIKRKYKNNSINRGKLLQKLNNIKILFGDCRDEDLINVIFGSVSEFARLVEELGDEFSYHSYRVTYDETSDIYYFWSV